MITYKENKPKTIKQKSIKYTFEEDSKIYRKRQNRLQKIDKENHIHNEVIAIQETKMKKISSQHKHRVALNLENKFENINSRPNTTKNSIGDSSENLYKNFVETKLKMEEIISEKQKIKGILTDNSNDLAESLQKSIF